MLAEAREKADAIRKQAQEKGEAEKKEILDRACEEAERIRSQAMASAQLKSRTLQLEHREKLLDSVFKTARQQLSSVQKWTDYEQIAASLLREAVAQLRASRARVRADERTQAVLSNHWMDEIAKELNAELSFGEPLPQGTGVIVETEDGHLYYDNTLETRLSRLQNGLRYSVYHILTGESL